MRFLLSILLVVAFAGTATAQQIEHLQIILVDTSPSMEGRLQDAFGQLLGILKKYPPSPKRPVVVIQYAQDVRSWARFTNLKPALAHAAAKPNTGGGTNHPAGLAAAIKELNGIAAQKNASVSIFWIADGNDVLKPETIALAKKIDAFFASRQETKFGPSINLWRWSDTAIGDNFLKSVIDALPHATINTGSFEDLHKGIHAFTANPQIELASAVGPDDQGTLTVTLAPSLRVSAAAVSKIENCVFTLRGPVQPSTGPLRFVVQPNKPAASHKVLLPLTPAILKQATMQLQFDAVATPKYTSSQRRNLFPSRQLTVTVPITPATAHYALHARAKLIGKPRWHDEDNLLAAYPIEVQVATVCKKNAPTKHAPVHVTLEPKKGHFLSKNRQVVVTQPGKAGVQTVSLELQIPVSRTANPDDVLSSNLTLNVAKSAKYTKYTPHKIVVDLPTLPLPPPIVSKVTFKTISITPPLWYEQPDVAVFRAEIDIHVDGPSSADLVVINAPGVTKFLTSPDKIHSGHQRGQFLVAARMQPAPAKAIFAFPVRVSNLEGPFKVELPKAIPFELTGPPALKLLAYHGRRNGSFQFAVHSSSRTTTFPVTLDLEGPHLPSFANGFSVNSRGVSPAGASAATLQLRQPAVVRCPLPSTDADSYATDSRHTVAMTFEPLQPTAAVLPCQRNADIVRYALLKQHLLVGFVAALVIALPLGVFYLIRSLRPSRPTTFI